MLQLVQNNVVVKIWNWSKASTTIRMMGEHRYGVHFQWAGMCVRQIHAVLEYFFGSCCDDCPNFQTLISVSLWPVLRTDVPCSTFSQLNGECSNVIGHVFTQMLNLVMWHAVNWLTFAIVRTHRYTEYLYLSMTVLNDTLTCVELPSVNFSQTPNINIEYLFEHLKHRPKQERKPETIENSHSGN